MTIRIAAVVFDLDGTLVDSLAGITAAIGEALSEIGRPVVTREAVRGFVGDGPRNLCLRALAAATGAPPLDPHDPVIDRLLLRFRALYAARPVRGTEPYPGVPELLDDLGGRPFAICTNKGRPVAELVLRHFDLERRCRLLVADGDLPWRKPDPRPILHAAERLGAAPAETLVVGDGPQDVVAAAAAGCPSCALLQGYGTADELRAAGPTWTLERIDRLPDLLRREAP
jgi:phosphoglycolate phosphatase